MFQLIRLKWCLKNPMIYIFSSMCTSWKSFTLKSASLVIYRDSSHKHEERQGAALCVAHKAERLFRILK